MDNELEINEYFENFRKNREQSIIDSVTQLMNNKFPDIQGLIVTMTSVTYDDPRYSLDEVTEYVMSLYHPDQNVNLKPI